MFDHFGPRLVFSLGLSLSGVAFLAASAAQQLWHLQLSIGLSVGFGIACIFLPMNVTAFATLPPELRAEATALAAMVRNIAQSLGVSVVTALSRTLTPDIAATCFTV